MAFTYDGTIDSDLERVRYLIGDTDSTDALLQDDEINYSLSLYSDVPLAAAHAAEAVAAKLARKADKKIGKLSISGSQQAQNYYELAKRLRREAYTFAEMFSGGQTYSGKDSLDQDGDLVSPHFEREQFTHPEASRFSSNKAKNDC